MDSLKYVAMKMYEIQIEQREKRKINTIGN